MAKNKADGLTAQQAAALDMLLAGYTVTQTAESLGLARETVSRWRNGDADFLAAYNAALRSAYEASQAKLLDGRTRAIATLAGLLDGEDKGLALKAALALLRVDVPEPTGPVSPAGAALATWLN